MGATALLYLGPLLAGLGGAGWPWAPAFAALFVMWLIALRPREWPRSRAEWRAPGMIVRALARGAVQVLLVVVLFGIGRGIGGVTGLHPLWPVWLPLAVSVLAVLLGRLVWDPWQAEALDALLDQALAALDASPPDAGAAEAARRAVAGLLLRPDDSTPADIAARLDDLSRRHAPEPLALALREAATAPQARRLPRLAFLLFATEGEVAERLGGDLPTRALALLPGRADLVALWAARGLEALDGFPGLWGDFPNEDMLATFLQDLAGTPAEAPLIALRDRLRDLAPAH